MNPPQKSASRSVAAAASRTEKFLRTQLWIWPLVAAGMLAFVGLWIRGSMEDAIRREIAGNLSTIRDANAEALRAWAVTMKSQAELLAGDDQVRSLVEALVKQAPHPPTARAPSAALPELVQLRAHLKPAEEGRGFAGYAVLDTNLVILAAGREEYIGANSPPEYAPQLAPAFAGNPVVTPPFLPEGMVPDESGKLRAGMPVMFAAAPIHSAGGQIIAVLGLRILPEKDFTRILATARSGASGETYAFDAKGTLLSESRFDDELKHFGLIPDAASARSLLVLDLRDPLLDLRSGERPAQHRADLPLIKPVREALAGGDGLDAHGYRDYRGIPVVGAWKWLPEFNLGLVTESEVAEALAPLHALRVGFWVLFALLARCTLAVFVLMQVAGRFHERARQATLKAEQLGQYALDDEIGSGGFGTVFRAHHALMRRPVAVKVLSPMANAPAIARFEREVQATCQLTHPNTIALYDYGHTKEGCFYYAMEYLDGLGLDRLIGEYGAQSEGRVIYILRQVCASLAEAHARGLVHRDIKPQNIFLTCRGGIPDFVKVLDFGLVKAREVEGQVELTGAHATLGTPRYMSPEAVQHPNQVDALTDIYALGAVGYELLTAVPLFCGTSVADVLIDQIRTVPDRPSTRLKHPLSADLEDLIMRCLAKSPSRRPVSATALDEALEHCSANGTWTRKDAQEWWNRRAAATAKTQALPRHADEKTAGAKAPAVGI